VIREIGSGETPRARHVAWAQRNHATLFGLGVPSRARQLSYPKIRARLAARASRRGCPGGAGRRESGVREPV
jgi:hypothetical protein